jgi:hypothetical protein
MYSNNKQIRDVANIAAQIMSGQQPVTEKLHPNQQQLDVHEPEKDELTADDFKKLRGKKEVKKEEVETIDEVKLADLPDFTTTRITSSAWLYAVPLMLDLLLKMMVHSFSPGIVQIPYLPAFKALPSIFTSLLTSIQVASLAPVRHTWPKGAISLPIVLPFTAGWL